MNTLDRLTEECGGAIAVPLPVAARLVGMTPKALRQAIWRGEGHWGRFPARKASPKPGAHLFVNLVSLAEWLDSMPGLLRQDKAGTAE